MRATRRSISLRSTSKPEANSLNLLTDTIPEQRPSSTTRLRHGGSASSLSRSSTWDSQSKSMTLPNGVTRANSLSNPKPQRLSASRAKYAAFQAQSSPAQASPPLAAINDTSSPSPLPSWTRASSVMSITSNSIRDKLRILSESDKELVASLRDKVEEQKRDLEEALSTQQAYSRNYEVLSQATKGDRETVDRLTRELAAAHGRIEVLTEQSQSGQELQAELDAAREELTIVNQQYTDMRARQAQLKQRMHALEKTLEEEKGSKTRLAAEMAGIVRDGEARKAQHQEAIAKLKAPLSEVPILQESLKEAKGSLVQLRQELANVQASLAEEKTTCEVLGADLKTLQGKHKTLSSLKDNLESDNASLRNRVSLLEESSSQKATSVARMKHELQQAKLIAADIPALKDEVKELQQKVQDGERNAILSNAAKKDLETRNEKLMMRIEEQQRLHQTELQQAAEKSRDLIALADNDRQKLNKLLDNARRACQEALDERDEFQRKLDEAHVKRREALSKVRAERSSELDTLKKDLVAVRAAREAQVSTLQEELEEVSAELEISQQSRAKLEEELEAARGAAFEPRMKMLMARESHLQATLAKVANATAATESMLTCMVCVRIFHKPTTCLPCRHTVCADCIDMKRRQSGSTRDFCPECGPEVTLVSTFVNEALDAVATKYTYQKQVIQALLEMCPDPETGSVLEVGEPATVKET